VDDVTGATVAANNADAKLSSLHYQKTEAKKSIEPYHTTSLLTDKQEYQPSLSDSLSKTKGQSASDSGGRESNDNDSPEDSNETSSSNGKHGKNKEGRWYSVQPIILSSYLLECR
jgi:hypothetical protein